MRAPLHRSACSGQTVATGHVPRFIGPNWPKTLLFNRTIRSQPPIEKTYFFIPPIPGSALTAEVRQLHIHAPVVPH